MSLLLLFAYPNPLSIPISELVTTAPVATNGYPIQRPATSGEWRWVVELADTADGDSALWRDMTAYYVGDHYQRGADEYLGRYRAAIAQVQFQIDDSDMLAPWGQDTSSIFGVDVRLDAGMLMRASLIRVVAGVVEEWEPIWTGRVESWGDASAARGQVRTHIVTVIDTSADLANVPTQVIGGPPTWQQFYTEQVLPQAGWLFGIDTYGDTSGLPDNDAPVAAINQLDQGTDPLGLVWRTLRNGRLVIHPAPWNTTNVDRYDNPLLDVYPDGLKFSYSPDLTDIEYIADDDQQPFGVERTKFGIINSIAITHPTDTDPETYLNDDPVSISRYGVRPLTATWVQWNGQQIVDDIIDSRAYATAQALPLRTTLDHEGFWSAMAIVDHYDPVTIWHATQEAGLVVTGTGVIRNIVEERTFRGTDGDTAELNWQSTVQIDLDAVESTPALLPVENLQWLSSFTPGAGGPSGATFSWDNPTQPDVEPTEVQLRVLGRSFLWFSEGYPGVGADGTTLGFLAAGMYYTLQVRLLRRVDGVVTHVSAIRQVKFATPNRIFPVPIPGDDPTDTDVDMPPFEDCQDDVSIELQENDFDPDAWVTVDTFSGTEIEQDDDGHWHLSVPIPNSFFNAGSMYRYLGFCGDELIATGPSFDPPDDWTDPCPDPAALSDPPFDDPSLLVYVPKVCTGFEDADPDFLFQGMLIIEAVSGIAGAHGDALAEIRTGITDPTSHALVAIADPDWSDTPGGILAYGECPQIVGHTGDKTWTVRVNVAQAEECVLFECAGGRITCVPSSGGWRAALVVYKTGSVTITLPTATELDEGTEYVIRGTFELATGTCTIAIDGVEDNTVGGTDDQATINALPIWRVGAPPGSWITDCALFGEVVVTPGPTVTINQGSTQNDPSIVSPIVFDVVFSEAVSGFATGDVTLTGTAGATTGTVSGSGSIYTVSVTGMTGFGTVIATINAGVCTSVATSEPNQASTSTDNTVTWIGSPWGWWDAADTSTITGGSSVTQWNDKSGNARHLTIGAAGNPSSGTRTLNSKNVVDFDGVNDGIGRTGSIGLALTSFCVFWVGGADADPLNGGMWSIYNNTGHDYDNNNAIVMNVSNSSNLIQWDSNGGNGQYAGAGNTPTAVWCLRQNGTGITLFRDGVSVATSAVLCTGTANGGMSLAWRASEAGNYLDCFIAEVIIYTGAVISDTDVGIIDGMLQAKWGL